MSATSHFGSHDFQKIAGLEGDLHDLFCDGLDEGDPDVADCKQEINRFTPGLSSMERLILKGIGLKYWADRLQQGRGYSDDNCLLQEQLLRHQAVMQEQLTEVELRTAQHVVDSIRLAPTIFPVIV